MNDSEAPRNKFVPWARRSWTDLGPRVISAVVLLPITAIAIYFGGYIFAIVAGAVFAGCYREWERMVTLQPLTPVGGILIGAVVLSGAIFPWLGGWASLAILALAAALALAVRGPAAIWRAGGLLFFGIVVIAILSLRGQTTWNIAGAKDWGFWVCLFMATVIWMTDTGAYFTGRQVGGEKLAPDISPSKTWSGAIGGFALGTLVGLVLWLIVTPGSPWWIGLLLAASLSIIGQVGDLTESAIKRRFRIKDSGDIIPGHGGLMDRLDSLTFAALFLFAVGFLHSGADAIAAGVLSW